MDKFKISYYVQAKYKTIYKWSRINLPHLYDKKNDFEFFWYQIWIAKSKICDTVM